MNSSLIIMRPYQGEPDLQQIVELFDDCARFDNLESSIPILQLQLPNCDFDLDQNLRLWENESGQLIGFGKLWIRELNIDNVASIYPKFGGGS
jgi:mycothiol synthase